MNHLTDFDYRRLVNCLRQPPRRLQSKSFPWFLDCPLRRAPPFRLIKACIGVHDGGLSHHRWRDTVHLDRSMPDSTCLIAAGPEYFGPIHVCPIHVGVTERGPAYWRDPFQLLMLGAYYESHASSGCAALWESVSWSNSYWAPGVNRDPVGERFTFLPHPPQRALCSECRS